MKKITVRYLDQLGQVKKIEVLGDRIYIVHTTCGVFYAKDRGRVYEVYTTETVYENLKQNQMAGV